MNYCYFQSPIGKILLGGTQTSLQLISFSTGTKAVVPQDHWLHAPKYFTKCLQQLTEYFAGTRQIFDLPYTLDGSDFKTKVLNYVSTIAYGTTTSYGEIAEKLGNPRAVRAVGTANATNSLPLIIPCHRVIGKDGSLTGFAGGIGIKAYLLDLEKRTL